MVEEGIKTILAVAWACWGKGPTLEDAVANCHKAGGVTKKVDTILYVFTGGTPAQHAAIRVDDEGAVHWPGADASGNEVHAWKLGQAVM